MTRFFWINEIGLIYSNILSNAKIANDNRFLKGYSPGDLNINVPMHVIEVIWMKYGFTSEAVRFRS